MVFKKLGAICLLTISILASETTNKDPVSPNYARRPTTNLPPAADKSEALQEKQLNHNLQKDGSNPKRADEKPNAGKKDSGIVYEKFFQRTFARARNKKPAKPSKTGRFFFR